MQKHYPTLATFYSRSFLIDSTFMEWIVNSQVRPNFMYFIGFLQHSSSAAPQISLCQENTGIESRTVAMLALAVSSVVDPDPEFFALEDPKLHSESGSGSKVTWNEE